MHPKGKSQNGGIKPDVWKSGHAISTFVETLPSGQIIKMKYLDTLELFANGIQPSQIYEPFKKFIDGKTGKHLDPSKIASKMSEKDIRLLLDMSKRIAAIAVIEPALTFEPEKEPNKYSVHDVPQEDCLHIMRKAMRPAQEFFRAGSPDTNTGRDGAGIRAEAEPATQG